MWVSLAFNFVNTLFTIQIVSYHILIVIICFLQFVYVFLQLTLLSRLMLIELLLLLAFVLLFERAKWLRITIEVSHCVVEDHTAKCG